jgi:mannose-6-phosphate isomerase-like protein (cupin superfamily)
MMQLPGEDIFESPGGIKIHNRSWRAEGTAVLEVVNLADKLARFTDHWSPRVVGELNGQQVKLAKLKGEFVWHHHEDADELFLVLKGRLVIQLRDGEVTLGPGEIFIVPSGIEHKPVAEDEVHVLLFEPSGTLNTGNVTDARTVQDCERI